jgi:RHS repeat-associated protein
MNLNGVEYYYIRNAQGDIIGLFDKTGAQVVSYTYDTWGKLISIDGSLKDSVGVKNPYRYRGYRYDTETGLYYLQSRYYNPEWGRFINEDGIIGQTGELLGHNLYVYTKNNPVNMSDKSGFRPIYTVGEETEEMAAASVAVMKRAATSRASSRSVAQIGMQQSYDMIINSRSIAVSTAKRPSAQFATGALNTIVANELLAPVGGTAFKNFVGKWGSSAYGIGQLGADAALAESGRKTTTQRETEMLVQGCIVEQQGEAFKYFALMNYYDGVGNWLTNWWDKNTSTKPNGTLQEHSIDENLKKWHGMQ